SEAFLPVLALRKQGHRPLGRAEVLSDALVAPRRAEPDVERERIRREFPCHFEAPFRSAVMSAKVRPSSVASCPVACRQRRTVPSTKAGESSIARHLRPSFSAARIWLPDPQNGSSTTAPAFVCTSIGISNSRVGFEVGWNVVNRALPSQST